MDKKDKYFNYRRIFPNANSILKIEGKTQDEIFNDAIFVLDTNSLLAPYRAGKDDLKKIDKIYKQLIKEDRLFIPEHVLIEFGKNRSYRISELYSRISQMLSQLPSLPRLDYPILGDLEEYKRLSKVEDKIKKGIKDYKENLTELKKKITDWNWADPVTSIYQASFKDKVIFGLSESEDELIEEYENRLANNIPPGNQDSTKPDNAIGDFLIWKTIIKIGKEHDKDVVFVSNDEKNDWLLKGDKESISTKFELVDEFYRSTKQRYFSTMTFKEFLNKKGLDIDFIDVESIIFTKVLGELSTNSDKSKNNYIFRKILENIRSLLGEYLIENITLKHYYPLTSLFGRQLNELERKVQSSDFPEVNLDDVIQILNGLRNLKDFNNYMEKGISIDSNMREESIEKMLKLTEEIIKAINRYLNYAPPLDI